MKVHLEYLKILPLSTSKGYIREKRDVKKSNEDHIFYEMLPHKNRTLYTGKLFTLDKDGHISIPCKHQKKAIVFLHFSTGHMAIKINKIVTKFKANQILYFSLFQNVKILSP